MGARVRSQRRYDDAVAHRVAAADEPRIQQRA